MAKQHYMKCQEMAWEEMRRCSSAGAGAAIPGWQDHLGSQALIQLYTSLQPFMGQTEKENFITTAKNIFVFWQHLAPATIRHLGPLHFTNTYRKTL